MGSPETAGLSPKKCRFGDRKWMLTMWWPSALKARSALGFGSSVQEGGAAAGWLPPDADSSMAPTSPRAIIAPAATRSHVDILRLPMRAATPHLMLSHRRPTAPKKTSGARHHTSRRPVLCLSTGLPTLPRDDADSGGLTHDGRGVAGVDAVVTVEANP